MTPAGSSGQAIRHDDAASALPDDGRSQRLCFRGSITQQLHSLCTLRDVGHPIATQHSVPGGGHLSRAAVEALQGSFERFQFRSSVRSPLPGFAWRTWRPFGRSDTRNAPVVSISADPDLTARAPVARSIESSYLYMPTRRDRFSTWHEHRRHALLVEHAADLLAPSSNAVAQARDRATNLASDRSTPRLLDHVRVIAREPACREIPRLTRNMPVEMPTTLVRDFSRAFFLRRRKPGSWARETCSFFRCKPSFSRPP